LATATRFRWPQPRFPATKSRSARRRPPFLLNALPKNQRSPAHTAEPLPQFRPAGPARARWTRRPGKRSRWTPPPLGPASAGGRKNAAAAENAAGKQHEGRAERAQGHRCAGDCDRQRCCAGRAGKEAAPPASEEIPREALPPAGRPLPPGRRVKRRQLRHGQLARERDSEAGTSRRQAAHRRRVVEHRPPRFTPTAPGVSARRGRLPLWRQLLAALSGTENYAKPW